MRALAACVLLFVGCHTPPAPPPASHAKSGLSVSEESFVQCGLADAQRKLHDCEDFDPDDLATFKQVDEAFVRVGLPPLSDPFGRPYRPRTRFHRAAGIDDKELLALARSYMCRTDLVPERRFPAGARAVAAYQAGRVALVLGRKEEAAVWLHEAALGPPDLPETAIASVVQLELLDELGRRAERAACYDVMEEWVHDAHGRLCDVERPYARRACPILGGISADLYRLSAFHTRVRP